MQPNLRIKQTLEFEKHDVVIVEFGFNEWGKMAVQKLYVCEREIYREDV